MTVREFCRHKTQALELCVIRDSGWIVHIKTNFCPNCGVDMRSGV